VPLENTHNVATLAEPLAVLSALTTELFLKCLICIETGDTPRGHDLKELFDQLSVATRTRIQDLWDSGIAVVRSTKWDEVEGIGALKRLTICRRPSLREAELSRASDTATRETWRARITT
jgi:hypothetical protein